MKKVFTFLTGVLSLTTLEAQQAPNDSLKNIQLEEVVVSATRATHGMPVAFTDIEKKSIDQNNFGRDIPYIMALSPSVTVTSDAGTGIGYTAFRIRGTDVNRINVTINGIPYNDAESHGVFFVDLPDFASSLASMQIQRGVGTSANGAAAFGASINMKTDNSGIKPYSSIGTSFGSFGTLKNTISVGTGLLNRHFAIDGRFSNVKSDGFIDRASADMQSYMFSATYFADKTMIKFLTFDGKEKTYQAWNGVDLDLVKSDPEHYTRHYNELGRYVNEDGNIRFYDNQIDDYHQTHYQLLLTQSLNEKWMLNGALHYTKGKGYYEEYKTDRDYAEYGLTPPIEDGQPRMETDLIRQKWLDNDFYGLVFAANYHHRATEVTLGGGANHYGGNHYGKVLWVRFPDKFIPGREWYRSTSDKNDWNIYVKTTSEILPNLIGFADLQFRHIFYELNGQNDKYDAEKGTMIDLTQQHDFSFFNPKAGLTYKINPRNHLYASFAVANREPNRNNYTDAGPNEKPTSERLYDTEVGYRYESPNFSFGANYYYMHYKNQLILTGKISEIGEPLTTNIPRSYRTGLELTTAIKFHPQWRWDANLTLSSNKIDHFVEQSVDEYDADWNWIGSRDNDLGQTDIAFSPNIIANSIFTFTYRQFETALQSSYVSRQYLDNTSDHDRSIDPYFVNHLRLSYSLKTPHAKSIDFGLLINNLFNTEYETNGYIWYTYYLAGKRVNEKRYFPQAGTNVLANIVVNF
ncbi:TonB-dependent receptor [Seramator thermalis]|uniref:TonB-dependent receptor n=1 Tax=Seramator thermalis TaxID=2496270 RepID=UPI00101DC9BB|nr:TonB-dependent receptor [Seramator thermalis]